MIPDLSTLVIYGVPAIVLIGVVIAVFKKALPGVDGDLLKLVTGAFGAVAYLFIQNQEAIELASPDLEKWLPQVLTMILIIGAAMGLTPGETATRVKNFVLRK